MTQAAGTLTCNVQWDGWNHRLVKCGILQLHEAAPHVMWRLHCNFHEQSGIQVFRLTSEAHVMAYARTGLVARSWGIQWETHSDNIFCPASKNGAKKGAFLAPSARDSWRSKNRFINLTLVWLGEGVKKWRFGRFISRFWMKLDIFVCSLRYCKSSPCVWSLFRLAILWLVPVRSHVGTEWRYVALRPPEKLVIKNVKNYQVRNRPRTYVRTSSGNFICEKNA